METKNIERTLKKERFRWKIHYFENQRKGVKKKTCFNKGHIGMRRNKIVK